jgi:hypothetical protein
MKPLAAIHSLAHPVRDHQTGQINLKKKKKSRVNLWKSGLTNFNKCSEMKRMESHGEVRD